MRIKCNWSTGWNTVYDALRICYDTDEHDTVEAKKKYVHSHAIVKGHDSVLEHCVLNFKIEDLERLILLQLERHRIASMTVESTRYTLRKILKENDVLKLSEKQLCKYFKFPQGIDTWERECFVDYFNSALALVQMLLRAGKTEPAKYALTESYMTQLYWTVNAKSLRNFLKLRLDKHASPAMEQLADTVLDALSTDVYWLFEDLSANANRRDIDKRWK